MEKAQLINGVKTSVYFGLPVFLFFLPLLFPPIFTDKFDFPKVYFVYLFTAILSVGIGLLIFLNKRFVLPGKTLFIAISLFAAGQLLSTLTSINVSTSLWGVSDYSTGSFSFLICMLVLFLITYNLAGKTDIAVHIKNYIVAAAVLVSLFGLYQYGDRIVRHISDYRIRSTIGEPNRLGLFLAICLPLAYSIFLSQKKKAGKAAGLAAVILLITGILLTLSRSAWLSLGIATLIYIIVSRKNYLPIFIFSVVFAILVFLKIPLIYRITSSYPDLAGGKGSASIRLAELKTGLQAAIQRDNWYQNLVGTGPATTGYIFPRFNNFKPGLPAAEQKWRTVALRNQYLELLVTGGIINLLAYSALVFTFIRIIFSKKYLAEINNGFTWAWLVVIIQNLFYYQTPVTGVLFWVFSAIIIYKDSQRVIINPGKIKNLIACLLIPGGLAAIIILITIGIADHYAASEDYRTAIKLNPFNASYKRLLSNRLSSLAYQQNDARLSQESVDLAKSAMDSDNEDQQNIQTLVKAYYIQGTNFSSGSLVKAEVQADKLRKLDPTNPFTWDNIGLLCLAKGDLTKALDSFNQAISLDPDTFTFYLHAGETAKQMGNPEQASQYLQKAYRLAPESPAVLQELKKIGS